MPSDVLARIEELKSKFGNPDIRFEKCDRNLAEFENTYSDGWVEVFVLFNNEDGAHYFWKEQKEDSQMKEFETSTAFSSNKEIKKHTHSIEPGGEPIEWTPIHTEEELHLAAKDGGSYYLAEDIKLTKTLVITKDMNICLNDKVLQWTNSYMEVIYIGENAIFNLCDCSDEKGTTRYWDKDKDGLWTQITNDSTSEYMTVGGVITGGYATYGGGVYNYGTFNMYGGSITGNRASFGGSGVYNARNFTMNGGSITGNTAKNFGGGVYNTRTFELNGGSITGNTADWGGGVCNEHEGTFTMNGGSITGNSASRGGGVCNKTDSTFTMYNGGITGNSAEYFGGGVDNWENVIFTLVGGSISGNRSEGNDICDWKG